MSSSLIVDVLQLSSEASRYLAVDLRTRATEAFHWLSSLCEHMVTLNRPQQIIQTLLSPEAFIIELWPIVVEL